MLPKHLDEKVAHLHLQRVGANLTRLTDVQADTSALMQTARTSRITTATKLTCMLRVFPGMLLTAVIKMVRQRTHFL